MYRGKAMEYINLDYADFNEAMDTAKLWQSRGFRVDFLYSAGQKEHRVHVPRIAVDIYNALQQGIDVVQKLVNLDDDRLTQSHLGGWVSSSKELLGGDAVP
jgi:hypothetical protein